MQKYGVAVTYVFNSCIFLFPIQDKSYNTLVQCCFDAGSTPETLAQHQIGTIVSADTVFLWHV